MCGIVGILSTTKKDTAIYIYDALTILQHRGQDAAGIVTSHKGRFYMRKSNGLVRNAFRAKHITGLLGDMGIGHVRYPMHLHITEILPILKNWNKNYLNKTYVISTPTLILKFC
jgi:glutamine phosphoribosylpyrophosphate amidotransferase